MFGVFLRVSCWVEDFFVCVPPCAYTPLPSLCLRTVSQQGLLLKMVDGVMATYRTNFFMPNRWALSLRVDPRLLMTEDELKVIESTPVDPSYLVFHSRPKM